MEDNNRFLLEQMEAQRKKGNETECEEPDLEATEPPKEA